MARKCRMDSSKSWRHRASVVGSPAWSATTRRRARSANLGSATVTRGPCALVGFGRADRLQGIMPQAALRGAWVGKQSERGKPSASRGQAMAAVARRASGGVRRSLERLDRFQQRNRVLALPFAVVRKFGDDQAGNLAALLAYYGFFSLFPLLLVLVTVLGFVLAGRSKLQARILDSALAQFPVIGDQIGRDVGSIEGSR